MKMMLAISSLLFVAQSSFALSKEETICGLVHSNAVSFMMTVDDGQNVELRVQNTWSDDTYSRLEKAVGTSTCVSGHYVSNFVFEVDEVL